MSLEETFTGNGTNYEQAKRAARAFTRDPIRHKSSVPDAELPAKKPRDVRGKQGQPARGALRVCVQRTASLAQRSSIQQQVKQAKIEFCQCSFLLSDPLERKMKRESVPAP